MTTEKTEKKAEKKERRIRRREKVLQTCRDIIEFIPVVISAMRYVNQMRQNDERRN